MSPYGVMEAGKAHVAVLLNLSLQELGGGFWFGDMLLNICTLAAVWVSY